MLAEALKTLFDAGRDAGGSKTKANILELPGRPEEFAIVTADGKVEMRTKSPADRDHVLSDLSQVAPFVTHVANNLEGTPSVWYSAAGATILIDDKRDSHRRDEATVELTPTKTHVKLRNNFDAWLSHKEFVRLLRVTLADAATEQSRQLLKSVRALSFREGSTGNARQEHGRASLGRDIEEQVVSEVGDIPEEVEFLVRLYDDPTLKRRFTIRCAVDINPREVTFNLCPLAGQFEDAIDEQLELIGAALEADCDCPVFRGQP